jgi:tellurite resistance protein TehA-like permease
MVLPRIRASTRPLLMMAVVLLAVLSAPTMTLWNGVSRHVRRLQEEDGEIVQNILWVAGFAAIAIAVVAIIRTFVLTEAQNLPTSGG